ncbi:MAG: hypothetical protein RQ824_12150 [bacterium]|nr:hypothetical protein [bacterium]
MAEEMRKQNASADEWMEFYEKLFEEKSPVKVAPLPIYDDVKELSKENKKRPD